jgi:hypothetical protein
MISASGLAMRQVDILEGTLWRIRRLEALQPGRKPGIHTPASGLRLFDSAR